MSYGEAHVPSRVKLLALISLVQWGYWSEGPEAIIILDIWFDDSAASVRTEQVAPLLQHQRCHHHVQHSYQAEPSVR